MSTRVKKLARQMGRTPGEVLGLLHALGFDRFRSPDDMLSDVVVRRVQEAERGGVKSAPVPVGPPPAKPKASAARRPDLESRSPSDWERVASIDAPLIPSERDARLMEREVLRSERDALLSERDALRTERDALLSERDALRTERLGRVAELDALRAERDALRAERDAWRVERRACEEARREAEVAARNQAVLAPVAAVLADVLLLYGCRRVAFVGVDLEHAWRRCLDPRVDGRFLPGAPRTEDLAINDVLRTDVVLLFGQDVTPSAERVYATAGAVVVRIERDTPILEWPECVRRALGR